MNVSRNRGGWSRRGDGVLWRAPGTAGGSHTFRGPSRSSDVSLADLLVPVMPGPRRSSGRATDPCGFYPSSSLSDAQWQLLQPLLPPPGDTASM